MTRAVAIRETGHSWKVEGLNGYRLNVTVDTAMAALRLVKLEDERASLISGDQVTTTVTWHTRTGIGRTVVYGITGEWGIRE